MARLLSSYYVVSISVCSELWDAGRLPATIDLHPYITYKHKSISEEEERKSSRVSPKKVWELGLHLFTFSSACWQGVSLHRKYVNHVQRHLNNQHTAKYLTNQLSTDSQRHGEGWAGVVVGVRLAGPGTRLHAVR